MENEKKGLAAKELIFGVILVLFSIYVILTSLGLKYMKTFMDGAGFFPLLIGIVLLILGSVLLYVAVKCGGVNELKEALAAGNGVAGFVKNDKTLRVLILIGMMVVYMYGLVGRIQFIPSTAAYIFANYMYLGACEKGKLPAWLKAAIISVVAAVATYYMMKTFLGITLP